MLSAEYRHFCRIPLCVLRASAVKNSLFLSLFGVIHARRERDGKAGIAVQAAGIHLPRQRNLRRHQRLLGLRPARRAAEKQHPRLVVAEHGRMSANWAGWASDRYG